MSKPKTNVKLSLERAREQIDLWISTIGPDYEINESAADRLFEMVNRDVKLALKTAEGHTS